MARLRCLSALVPFIGFALACSGGGGGYGGQTPTAPGSVTSLVVEIRDFEFVPRSIRVQPGETVVWRLAGSDPTHTVTAVGGMFDSGFTFSQPGSTFSHTFTAADDGKTFLYWCATHHVSYMMQGSVQVGDLAPPPDPGY